MAFVCDGGVFLPTEIKIYQDGMIDCWGLIPLAEFEEKVAEGWVVGTPPGGAKIKMPSPAFTLMMSLYVAAIAGVSGGSDEQVTRMVYFNLLFFFVISVAACAAILCFPKAWLLSLSWRKVLISSDIGSVVFSILYILAKLGAGSFAEFTTGQTLLLGGLYGLIYGGIIWVIIGVIDDKATPFTRAGVARYAVLYLLVLIVGLIRKVVDDSGKIGDFLSTFVFLALLGVVTFGVWWWDRRKEQR